MNDQEALKIERYAFIDAANQIGYFGNSELYNNLMDKARAIELILKDNRKSDNYTLIKNLANHYWLIEGMPDGERFSNSIWGQMKIKDIHWKRAQEAFNLGCIKG